MFDDNLTSNKYRAKIISDDGTLNINTMKLDFKRIKSENSKKSNGNVDIIVTKNNPKQLIDICENTEKYKFNIEYLDKSGAIIFTINFKDFCIPNYHINQSYFTNEILTFNVDFTFDSIEVI